MSTVTKSTTTHDPSEVSDKELPAFPQSFLDMMRAYAHLALEEQLRKLNASADVIHLLEDMVILNDLQVIFASAEDVEMHWNMEAQECVSNIAREVAELGVQFPMPYEA